MSKIIIGNTIVNYNRSMKSYTAINGTIDQSFPSGPDGKQAALLAAIGHENAELAGLVTAGIQKQPHMAKSWLKAGTAVVNGLVYPPRMVGLDQVAWIQSKSRLQSDYDLELYNQFVRCQCEAYQFKKAPQASKGQLCCWHVLASLLAMRLELIPKVEVF